VHSVLLPLSHSGREDSYHALLDACIRNPLMWFLSESAPTWDRNTGKTSSVRADRPDLVINLQNTAILRGEEREEGGPSAAEELRSKIGPWPYVAPYLLGYSTLGALTYLWCITRDGIMPLLNGRAFNLDALADRLRLLSVLRNLARLMPRIAAENALHSPEFSTIIKKDNNEVVISAVSVGYTVIKEYFGPNARATIEHVRKVYEKLKSADVPHVPVMVSWRAESLDCHIVFKPRGMQACPKSPAELLYCISCILQMLAKLHESVKMMHRDLRWANIVKVSAEEWLVVDFDDASPFPAQNSTAQHLARSKQVPEMKSKTSTSTHSWDSDIYQVGLLIQECAVRFVPLDDLSRNSMATKAKHRKSASNLLESVKGFLDDHLKT